MICQQYKCVFVHIPKTGGQSIETVFLDKLGLDWETREPLLLRKNDSGIGPPRLAHLTAIEYFKYNYLTKELYNSYFKFTFVRNPWDRVVSFYHYLNFNEDFDYFVKTHLPELFKTYYWFVKPQLEFIYNNDYLMVDFVGRYEKLQSDFSTVCVKSGIENTTLTHKNKSERKLNNYQDYYTNSSKDLIYKLYKQDINKFGYEF